MMRDRKVVAYRVNVLIQLDGRTQEAVRELLSGGWQPWGAPVVVEVPHDGMRVQGLAQAWVKYEGE